MKDVIVIGGGPSGLAAASSLAEKGYNVAIIERKEELGGILDQCIHDGFGTKIFRKALSGPEFVDYYIDKINKLGVDVYLESFVKTIDVKGDLKKVICISPKGVTKLETRALIFAVGCREKTPFEIKVGGTRPAGVYTAGMVQRLINIYGILPGKNVLLVGGGDVGMIVARHLYLEGVESILVVYPEDFFVGLPRNVQQCILDFNIPYRPRTIVKEIVGKKRVEGAILTKVDKNWNPIPGTEEFYKCDSIIFSVGLVPYTGKLEEINAKIDPKTRGPEVNEFFETSVPGIFAVGNLVQIFDYVDDAVESALISAEGVEKYLAKVPKRTTPIKINPGNNVLSVIPQRIEWEDNKDIISFFRPAITIKNAILELTNEKNEVLKTFRRPFVRPSTLERIKISRKVVLSSKEVFLNVRESS